MIDAAVKALCANIVDAYAQKKHATLGDAPTPPQRRVHPDFSTGMEAVTVALALCSQVQTTSTFG